MHFLDIINASLNEGYDKQRRSPNVIARLMGLEQLPSNDPSSSLETVKKPELQQSASESRKQIWQMINAFENRDNAGNVTSINVQNSRVMESMTYSSRNQKSESHRTSQWRSLNSEESFFELADFFPEPKQTVGKMYGISNKNLNLRGIDEQSNDQED
ncbi:hypothetical protein L1887_11403 [Cichorium endivia]|nr:hypothetical protein L1887_11403 [Cichorium endivia]